MKKKKMSINDYYKSLSRKEKSDFRQEVMLGIEIAYPTFDQKMRNDSWKNLERDWILNFINKREDA